MKSKTHTVKLTDEEFKLVESHRREKENKEQRSKLLEEFEKAKIKIHQDFNCDIIDIVDGLNHLMKVANQQGVPIILELDYGKLRYIPHSFYSKWSELRDLADSDLLAFDEYDEKHYRHENWEFWVPSSQNC